MWNSTTQEPAIGELRFIARLKKTVLPKGNPAAEVDGGTVIEGKDVFLVDGQTRSKCRPCFVIAYFEYSPPFSLLWYKIHRRSSARRVGFRYWYDWICGAIWPRLILSQSCLDDDLRNRLREKLLWSFLPVIYPPYHLNLRLRRATNRQRH